MTGAVAVEPSGTPRALERDFFARSTEDVATALVGRLLVVDEGTRAAVAARLVEVEAYLGPGDQASHAHRCPTGRAAIMFGVPGRLYVYVSYGIHHCVNVVTESDGVAGAVLLRAAAVETGEDTVRRRRLAAGPSAALLRGPGNLCRGLSIGAADNGLDICAASSRVRIVDDGVHPALAVGPRVGITRDVERPLRFWWAGSPAVSSRVRAALRAPT